jgi:hypothetical protein
MMRKVELKYDVDKQGNQVDQPRWADLMTEVMVYMSHNGSSQPRKTFLLFITHYTK